MKDSSILIENSVFRGLGDGEMNGVCIDANDSPSVTIKRSNFENNRGSQIGCLDFTSKLSNPCAYSISDSVFVNNSASLKGGAIFYDSFRPVIANSTFINNSAAYGPNIASYPVRVAHLNGNKIEDSLTFTQVVAGQSNAQNPNFALVDAEDQIYSIESTSQI